MFIKPVISGLLLFISSGTACTVYAADYNAADLNTLFTDKNQRAQIDAARSGKTVITGIKKTSEVEVSGYMTRSEGKSVVWLNDKNTLKSSTVDGVRVHQSSIGNNKKVTVTIDGKTKSLKPGESWSKNSGKIKDNY
ncbi:MAG: hypothetical protein RQ982_05960 [Gammaproteobacteria bacterium]|nr:hypothetical protein [Gammaproteobacteria bacterium]